MLAVYNNALPLLRPSRPSTSSRTFPRREFCCWPPAAGTRRGSQRHVPAAVPAESMVVARRRRWGRRRAGPRRHSARAAPAVRPAGLGPTCLRWRPRSGTEGWGWRQSSPRSCWSTLRSCTPGSVGPTPARRQRNFRRYPWSPTRGSFAARPGWRSTDLGRLQALPCPSEAAELRTLPMARQPCGSRRYPRARVLVSGRPPKSVYGSISSASVSMTRSPSPLASSGRVSISASRRRRCLRCPLVAATASGSTRVSSLAASRR